MQRPVTNRNKCKRAFTTEWTNFGKISARVQGEEEGGR